MIVVWSYLTLFGWSFAAATILPLGSEPAVVYMVARDFPLASVIAVATVGNYLGACTTYAIGGGLRKRLESNQRTPSPRASRLVAAYGAPALALSWVPLIGDAIGAAAGVAGMPFGRFSFWTVRGKLGRYVAVAYGAHAYIA